MSSPVPDDPKVYHIVHVDRLPFIIAENRLLCDAEIARHPPLGTTIGMDNIKQRRLNELSLSSHPGLMVGECVPFYFCPRSVMLYVINQANYPGLSFTGGQDPIVHLEANLQKTIDWAGRKNRRWAFTTSNAGSRFFDDYSNLEQLDRIDWNAVQARDWRSCKDQKQAEFLVERSFPWKLVTRIGVLSRGVYQRASASLDASEHKPRLEITREWYY